MVLSLKRHAVDLIPLNIKEILKGYKYVFNPSYIFYNDLNYLAVRVYDDTSKSILAKLVIWNSDVNLTEVDLSQFFKEKLALDKVADPKLFIMNNAVWCTFNSGHTDKEDNKLVLFKIEGSNVKEYYSCNYKDRNQVEKNWAFYFYENEIFALYSLNGLVILKATSIDKHKMVFENHFNNTNINFGAYTIGTPLALYNGNYLFIGHRKITRKGKRLYLGKPFLFKPSNNPELTSSKKYVIHSLKSLFGAKHKFNRFLISCTYFSGIYISKNKVIVSYGVNDVSWKIVKLNISKIWR
ncbi:hypothetical protein [Olleya sp. Bg11-27]|uniref:hypothetical protein n=1 Tax=Olleya sp. Bg11-27 TaxID=2058135 RepID=UPI000C3127C9|nr:hypothetical protein [Olleya sp. Bg11-27]AUC75813.1 hypothetical protein CW732_09025 [Olleya sp. Bg11-27]